MNLPPIALNLLAIAVAYLIGALPVGVLVTRLVAGVDLRTVGSGNPGFSNAARVLGWKAAAPVLALDVLKGFVPALALPWAVGLRADGPLAEQAWRLAIAIAPVVGHCLSVFLKFKGGKGVATSLGVYLALAPAATLFALAVGVGTIAVTRYMSLGSMVGAVFMAVAVVFTNTGEPLLIGLSVALAVVIVFLHRANIGRLLAGTERRFGERAGREN